MTSNDPSVEPVEWCRKHQTVVHSPNASGGDDGSDVADTRSSTLAITSLEIARRFTGFRRTRYEVEYIPHSYIQTNIESSTHSAVLWGRQRPTTSSKPYHS